MIIVQELNFRIFVLLLHLLFVSTSESSTITRQEDGFYKCPQNPITERYVDPNDPFCLYYFLCHRGHAFPAKCPFRSIFHPILKECMPRDRVPESICANEIKCGFNGYYKDPKDCTKYFLCFYQTPTHYSCTADRVFDDKKKQCISNKKRARECSKPKPLPHFATTPRTTQTKLSKPNNKRSTSAKDESDTSSSEGNYANDRMDATFVDYQESNIPIPLHATPSFIYLF